MDESKPVKFFFEEDNAAATQNDGDSFFEAMKAAGVVQEAISEDMTAEKQVSADGSMKKLESRVTSIEFGSYRGDYSVHVTPTHPTRNLGTDEQVKKALTALAVTLNEYVPHTVRVDLFLPQKDWEMKVISAKVVGGADIWNFDKVGLEEKGLPKLLEAVDKIILVAGA